MAPHQEVITDTRGSATTTTFAQVIKQARSHDEEAVVVLYQRALPVIYRYALARLGRPDLVEDVVSEVFLEMVESIDELRTEQEAGFYACLLQIAQGKISRAIRHYHDRVGYSFRSFSPLDLRYSDSGYASSFTNVEVASITVSLDSIH